MLEALMMKSFSKSGTWKKIGVGTMTSRSRCSIAELNGDLYLSGGFFGSPSYTQTGELWRYSTSKKTWTKLSSLVPVSSHGSVFVNGKLYVIGGQTTGNVATDICQRYDPETNRWTIVSPMPGTRQRFAYGTIGRKIYVHGGAVSGGSKYNNFWEYDTETDVWSVINKIDPGGIRYHTGVGHNGKFYIFGGETDSSGSLGTNLLWEYNPETTVWKRFVTNIASRSESVLISFGGKLGVQSGHSYNGAHTYFNDFWISESLEIWNSVPNDPGITASNTHYPSAVSTENKAYLYKTMGSGEIWEYS